MPDTSYDLELDLTEAKHMVNSLENYVRQEDLYYKISTYLPILTMGGFLLRVRRLYQFEDQLLPEQLEIFQDVQSKHMQIRDEWRYHYTQKLLTEIKSRLNVIQYYLNECDEAPQFCQEHYRPEAFRRTLIQEILYAIKYLQPDQTSAIENLISYVDNRLRPLLDSTYFLWDDRLKPVYPSKEFWWLYSQPLVENAMN